MNYTTTTKIARKGSKIFRDFNEAIVLSNNKPVWALLSFRIYERLKASWYLDEITKSFDTEKIAYLRWLETTLSDWEDAKHDNLFA